MIDYGAPMACFVAFQGGPWQLWKGGPPVGAEWEVIPLFARPDESTLVPPTQQVTGSDGEVEAAARAICKCWRSDTGEGTCAAICMDVLGDGRSECEHCVEVHGKLARPALAAAAKARTAEIATGEAAYTTGHCPEHNKPGGCQLHNLHCGWPECDRRALVKP